MSRLPLTLASLGLCLASFGRTPARRSVWKPCAEQVARQLERSETRTVGPAEVTEILPGVFYIRFDTQEELGRTFLRFQEHYESPEFRGRIFTLDEFRRWYARESGAFTYYTDWVGFNFPSYVMEPFFDGKFDPLTDKEQRIVDILRPHRGKKFYVIGAFGKKGAAIDPDELSTIIHEVSHAMFYMDDDYRREVLEVVRSIDATPIRRALLTLGYCDAVLDDEVNAALLAPGRRLAELVDLAPFARAAERAYGIYLRYFRQRSLPGAVQALDGARHPRQQP